MLEHVRRAQQVRRQVELLVDDVSNLRRQRAVRARDVLAHVAKNKRVVRRRGCGKDVRAHGPDGEVLNDRCARQVRKHRVRADALERPARQRLGAHL